MIAARGTLQGRLFRAMVLVTAIAVVLPVFYARDSLYEDRLVFAGNEALARLDIIASVLAAGASPEQITALLNSVKATGSRMTLAASDGVVLHDSHVDGEALPDMDNHNDRPEIEDARSAGRGVSIRRGSTLGMDAVYAAVALPDGSILRLAVPVADIRRTLDKDMASLVTTATVAALLCLLFSILVARRFRTAVDDMAEIVAGIAKSKGGHRLLEVPGREFLPLAHAVNRMAENIEEYVVTTTDQHTQLEVILDSIHEGILVLGPTGTIRRYNSAARDLFPALGSAQGRQLIEALPAPSLQHGVDMLLGPNSGRIKNECQEPIHLEIDGRFLVAHVSRPVEKADSLGAVIVIYDATHIMKLERVRRDFVANISHELRTPLTAISGYAETLMEMEGSEEQTQFAAVIYKHAKALGRVIGDLLTLARVEDEKEVMVLSPVDPSLSIQEAIQQCAQEAARGNVHFVTELAPGHVLANASLLTQVFRNLLENACRYSPQGGQIVICSTINDGQMLFAVKDHGPGIAQNELGRIFERLYQVKKQRNSGTSGIGLAISKHIIERHAGRLWAESPYEGCATAMLFTLPLAEPTGSLKGAE